MAGPPFNLDETLPEDDDVVSQFPANERANRDRIESWIAINHDTNGNHTRVQLADLSDTTFGAGLMGVWQNSGFLNTRLAAGTLKRIINMPVGTRMIFDQATAPAGWTTDSAAADKVLRVVASGSGGVNSGTWTISGLTIGNTVLTVSQLPVHSHDLGAGAVVAGGGDHSHGGLTGSTGDHDHQFLAHNSETLAGAGAAVAVLSGTQQRTTTNGDFNHQHTIAASGTHIHAMTGNTNNTGSGSGHDHTVASTGAWRPASRDVVIGVLQ